MSGGSTPRLVKAAQTWLRWSVPWWATWASRTPTGERDDPFLVAFDDERVGVDPARLAAESGSIRGPRAASFHHGTRAGVGSLRQQRWQLTHVSEDDRPVAAETSGRSHATGVAEDAHASGVRGFDSGQAVLDHGAPRGRGPQSCRCVQERSGAGLP